MRHPIFFLGLLVFLAVFAGAAQAQGEFEEGPCAFDVPEGADIMCGWAEVPEFHADPDGPTIRLAMAVLKSSSDTPVAPTRW